MIVIERARGRGDAYMAIWNADGSDGGQCGNAARCVAQTLMAEKAARPACSIRPAGLLAARLAEAA